MHRQLTNGKLISVRAQDRRQAQPEILVVDDCELVRVLMRMALERAGFRVWLAPSGQHAIKIYREHGSTIAAVLLDVQMPEMDGPRTLDVLRQLNPELQACFVSGDTGEYTPEELLQRGAQAVFHKPFRVADLGDAVRRMVDGKPPESLAEGSPELRSTAIFVSDMMCVPAARAE